jgi:hypothetical protein
MMIPPIPALSNKLLQITSALILNTTQVAAIIAGILVILAIDNNIEEYYWELLLLFNMQKDLQATLKDNIDYIYHISILENNPKMANKTIQILQNLITNTLTLYTIELPYPPKYSGDRKELPNCITKVHLKLIGENSQFSNNQHILYYIYSYWKGNSQKQI